MAGFQATIHGRFWVTAEGKRHAYTDAVNYFFWLRADYFVKHLIGDFSQPVDMFELNREREQSTDKTRARATN